MSICYLTTPLQHQIKTVLHELSHSLELPHYVLSHESEENVMFTDHGEHSYGSSFSGHSHGIIDFIDTIFEASNEDKDSKSPQHSETKLDKHLTNSNLQLPLPFRFIDPKGFCPPKSLQIQDRHEELKRPPQDFPC